MSGEIKQNSDNIILNYALRKEYFVNKNLYFKDLLSQCSNISHKPFCLLNKVYQSEDFGKKIKEEKIINDYYQNAKKNLENAKTIEILKNGLFIYARKMLLYCVKDEEIEDNYLSDVHNISCIKHEDYDKLENNSSNTANSAGDNISKSFKSDSKYDKNAMTGLKNRGFVLESLVNFFFRQFQIMPLPNLLINLDYVKGGKKSENSINLFYEWDGCYLLEDNENKNDVTFETDFALPFNKEIQYKISHDNKTEKINNNILIKKNSIVFIEVKTHFPKEIEENKNNNLENIIKVMFLKLNYFTSLYSKILKNKVKEIKIILLYDQNHLRDYKKTIEEFIDKYKNNFLSIKDYEIYFDILYIIPYISKLSLNQMNKKLLEANEKIEILEKEIEKIKILEKEKEKEIEKIKILEKEKEKENEKVKKELELIKLKLGLVEDKSSPSADKNIIEKSSNIPKTEISTPKYDRKKLKIYSNIIIKDEDKNQINKNISKVNVCETKTPLKEATTIQAKNIPKIIKNNENKKIKPIGKKKVNILNDNDSEKVINAQKNKEPKKITETEKEETKSNKYENKKEIIGEAKEHKQEIKEININNKEKNEPEKYEQEKDAQKLNENKKYDQSKEDAINKNNEKKEDEYSNKKKKEKENKESKKKSEFAQKTINDSKENKIDDLQKGIKKENNIISIKSDKTHKDEHISIKNEKNEMKININDENILEKKSDISSISISKNENIRIVKDKEKSEITSNQDIIYERIQLKIKNGEVLLEKEKIYLIIYENCKQELGKDFSLISYKKNHTSGQKSIIKNCFHKSLQKLNKEQRQLFFYNYGFLPCMSTCTKLI